jgi:anti-sigma factor RsiW
MRTCSLFDRYRDGELGPAEQSKFQSHLAICEDCRGEMALLNNLVHILKQEEIPSLDLANRIARRAFLEQESWAALVVSWLRPGPAWAAALSIMLVLFSFLWLMPGSQKLDTYSEYEKLMSEAEDINLSLSTSISQARSDSELVLWLQQEGTSQ